MDEIGFCSRRPDHRRIGRAASRPVPEDGGRNRKLQGGQKRNQNHLTALFGLSGAGSNYLSSMIDPASCADLARGLE